MSVMYSKPVSINCMASCSVLAVLQLYSSVVLKNVACSMLMYMSVQLIVLCPKTYFTCMMSFVLWYSIVPLKCLNVCSVILCILGLFSFLAVFRFSLS